MNCKPGDLAIIVRSCAGHEGKIVRIVRWVGKVRGWVGDDRWETDTQLRGERGGLTRSMRDSALRPIRDPGDDAKDEMLRPLPKEEPAHA